MTEAEVALFTGAHGLALTTLSIFISVVTAYLVAAYLVGRELTRFQVGFLSLVFLVFSSFAIWGTFVYFLIGEGNAATWLTPIGPRPSLVSPPIQALVVVGCLYFMRSIRKG